MAQTVSHRLSIEPLSILLRSERFCAFAQIDAGLLDDLGAMDAYYDIYISHDPIGEFLRDVNVRASDPIFSELLSPSGIQPPDVREVAVFFTSMQRQERREGWSVSRSYSDAHKLIR